MSTGAPEAVTTGERFALILRDHEGLEVVQVSADDSELATWYKLECEHGRLARFQPVADLAARNRPDGGIWALPAGTEVFPGWRMVS